MSCFALFELRTTNPVSMLDYNGDAVILVSSNLLSLVICNQKGVNSLFYIRPALLFPDMPFRKISSLLYPTNHRLQYVVAGHDSMIIHPHVYTYYVYSTQTLALESRFRMDPVGLFKPRQDY